MTDVKTVSELSKGEEILLGDTAFLTRLDKAIGWARKYSIFPYPFATACCAMEYMALSMSPYDIDRFGALLPRFTPRQADLLMVIGTVTMRQAPILRRVYEQMARAEVGDGVRRVRVDRRLLRQLCHAARYRSRSSPSMSTSPDARRGPKVCSTR